MQQQSKPSESELTANVHMKQTVNIGISVSFDLSKDSFVLVHYSTQSTVSWNVEVSPLCLQVNDHLFSNADFFF